MLLTKDDIGYYRSRGFNLEFDGDVITGHIDFLQIRKGHIHILDYKPEARKETHAHVQFTIYALALARRTDLPLKFFKCRWFDEQDYSEFFSLQSVYRRRETIDENEGVRGREHDGSECSISNSPRHQKGANILRRLM